MGHISILLIAGDFLQIKPANEFSLADNLEELIRKIPHRVQTEHHLGGVDEHRYSEPLEKGEAIPGCSSAGNYNNSAHVHAHCTFVRGSPSPAAHPQNQKLQ